MKNKTYIEYWKHSNVKVKTHKWKFNQRTSDKQDGI